MFQIDKFGRTPIYEQVIEQAERLILTGALKPGEQMPSVRALSQKLCVNPNTLQKAYAELERQGITMSVPGSGRFVAADAVSIIGGRTAESIQDVKSLCAKLCAAGVPMERVITAVEAAYGKEVES